MRKRNTNWSGCIPWFAVHAVAIGGVIWSGWSWSGLALAVALYYVRMFGVTGGYHRYFAHRTYRTSRAFQFVLACLAQSSLQKGVLWWAAHHREHHKYSDTPKDPHSYRDDGFWYSHMGWIMQKESEVTHFERVKDLARFPELRWLNQYFTIPGITLAVGLYLVGGWHALLWGFFVSTSLLWHGTFTINSLSHCWGRRRYVTTDDSRNNFVLALVTMGEGWHNNHHYYPRSVNQGFFWWEIDLSYAVLRLFSYVGLVWDLHTPPARVVAGGRENTPTLSTAPAPLSSSS